MTPPLHAAPPTVEGWLPPGGLPIVAPNGAPAGWVVRAEGLPRGFAQLDARGRVLRIVRENHGGALDPRRARAVLGGLVDPAATVAAPQLSFDGEPTRLVWAFRVRDAGGERVWHVVGDEAWRAALRAEPIGS